MGVFVFQNTARKEIAAAISLPLCVCKSLSLSPSVYQISSHAGMKGSHVGRSTPLSIFLGVLQETMPLEMASGAAPLYLHQADQILRAHMGAIETVGAVIK